MCVPHPVLSFRQTTLDLLCQQFTDQAIAARLGFIVLLGVWMGHSSQSMQQRTRLQ